MRVYIGSYETAEAEGIHWLSYDEPSGRLEYEGGTAGLENPAFLILNRSRTRLYAVSETDWDGSGADGRKVVSYEVDPARGSLRMQSEQPTLGGASCHVSLSADERLLFVANYSGGNAAVFPIGADGEIEAMSALIEHSGKGPLEARQEGPHPHSVNVDPSGQYVAVPDLGIDQVVVYRIDGAGRTMVPASSAALPGGAGPRHMAFHPVRPFAYVVNELDSTVTVFAVDRPSSSLDMRPLQHVTTLPEGYADETTCADIHLTPDGSYLYASNRGHDSLAIFRVREQDGLLEPAGYCPTGGRTPRNFAISPDGRFIVAANQDSDSLVVFRIDPASGHLTETQRVEGIRRPVCVQFADL